MAEKIKFTQQRIEKLPVPESGRVDYHDLECPKLTCRVSHTGVKTFAILKWDGRTARRVTIGRFPDITVHLAREEARKGLSDLASGINPTEKKRAEKVRSMTLEQLLAQYLDQKQLRPASVLDYQKKTRQGFKDWMDKPVNLITRDMVLARHKKLNHGIDNKMRVLRLLMRYAMALKVIESNPVDVLKEVGLWSKPKRKSRIVSADTLKDWHDAVLQLPNTKAKVYLLILIYTGLRSSEALNLLWQDVDFKNDTLTVRDTKNHSDFTTYIPKQLKPYLRALQEETDGHTHVFPGGTAGGAMDTPRKAIAAVTRQTGIAFSSHDLRRTFATIAEAALLPETLIKKLLNHETNNNVTGGYIRTEADTLRQAIDRIAGFIQGRVAAEGDNILLLKAQ